MLDNLLKSIIGNLINIAFLGLPFAAHSIFISGHIISLFLRIGLRWYKLKLPSLSFQLFIHVYYNGLGLS